LYSREPLVAYRKAAKRAPAKPRPRTGSSMPAPFVDEDEELLLELPEVAVPVEEPAAELAVVELPWVVAAPELLREPVLTVLLEPVEPLLEPEATGTRVVPADGVPAGTVAAACWEVMTDG